MAISTIPAGAASGLASVQDLYDMINGKTTTTSGGSQTTTSSEGISQESMNAMLQNALSSTNGLAAISQGQRSAGGYGSSVNTMLTNDLLTRTAAQIAASQKNSTSTVVKSPTETTTGGITVTGAAKSAGFLAALQQLADTGTSGKKLYNLITGTPDAPTSSSIDAMAPMTNANATMSASSQYASYGGGDVNDIGAGVGGIDFGSMQQFSDTAIDASGGGYNDTPVDIPMDQLPTETFEDFQLPADLADFSVFADGGLVGKGGKHPMVHLADGGAVNKKGLKVLGTSQYNSIVDPREGLAGTVGAGGNAVGADGMPVGQTISDNGGDSTPVAGSGGNAGRLGSDGETVSFGGSGVRGDSSSLAGALGNIVGGEGARADYGTLASAAGIVGALSGNQGLANAGKLGSIAASESLTQAGLTAANIATKGAVGEVYNVVKAIQNPSLGATVDAVASFNPMTAVTNRILSLAGVGSIGDIADNAKAMIAPNNPMSAEQQDASRTAIEDNARAIAAQESQMQAQVAQQEAQEQADALAAAQEQAAAANVGNVGGGGGGGGRTTQQMDRSGPSDPGGFGTMGGGGYGTSADGGGGESDGGDGGGSENADGGHIQGPGTGISDSIDAKLSDGEFVLSADVVKAIGVDKLQALQDKYHTPAAVQKLQAFGKVR